MAIITKKPLEEDKSIHPDPNLIFYFDNLLPEWIEKWGVDQMGNFDWRYGQASYPGGGQFFGQILKDHTGMHNMPWPSIVDTIYEAFKRTKLLELIPDARITEAKKVIVNGQLPTTPADPHADTQASNMWTMVYHCSDTDGDNLFFTSEEIPELKNKPRINNMHRSQRLTEIKRVPFKQGRCVLFPSWYIHQGLTPTNGWRITIAFHMNIETSINPPRFITSII
jgi:hypothetical protein